MTDVQEPKLTPEAVKMLNDMAADRQAGVPLTPEAQANLEKFTNFHLTHTYQAHKSSYLVMALVLAGLGVGSILYGLNMIMRDPLSVAEHASSYLLMCLVPVGFAFGAFRFWSLYNKL